MAFQLQHTLLSREFTPERHIEGESAFFTVSLEGEFSVLFPGPVSRGASATFIHRFQVESVDDSHPLHGGFESVKKIIPLVLRIFMPDGREFTATEVTLADLKKFRNQRGGPSGPWKYRLTGESEKVFLGEDSKVIDAKGGLHVSLVETVRSESAPPLVENTPVTAGRKSFQFDLFRVGTFVAEIHAIFAQWRGTMRLVDPDGVEVARSAKRTLTFDVSLSTLGKSRDAAGRVRKWTLEVSRLGGALGSPRVRATVIGKGRITIGALKSRLETLLGPHGAFIEIFGENKGGDALLRLRVNDIVSAETIDLQGLLEGVLSRAEQDGGVDPRDFQPNTVYTLIRKSEEVEGGLKLDVSGLKVKSIDVDIGPGVRLGASVPAIRLTVAVSGQGNIKRGSASMAVVKVRGGKFAIEIGIKLSRDGTPQIVTAIPDSLLDIDPTVLGAPFVRKIESAESDANEDIFNGLTKLFADPTIAPRILMMIFGAHLDYQTPRIEGEEIVFDHIAPLEPDPRPTPGYLPAIGREVTQSPTNAVSFTPAALGDTWLADNLRNRIEHIVVVMMENRSYDHVLGYRAQPPFNDGAKGLTTEMIKAIEQAQKGPFKVRNLRDAKFAPNKVGLMTRLPKGVGHEFEDVEQQLSVRTNGPANDGTINSPEGFVENFKPRLKLAPKEKPHNVEPDDVLGFYDQESLPFFAYLAENYVYCDRYYCSHPGPTLPNRMYSLTGDLQHDRYGFPIFNNNDGDNFLLSRAPTIYDLMIRRGLSFRIYESEPSVTMLRMFARYATDTVNIVPISQLEADLAPRGRGLPAFTAIEPQMHAQPEDDDHPDADMHRGQIFVKRVYDALTSNRSVWEKTLLIITYDEHGGFYDHVVPPIADVFATPQRRVAKIDPSAVITATPLHSSGGAASGSGAPSGGGAPRPTRTTAARHFTVASHLSSTLGTLPQLTQLPPPPTLIRYGVRVPTFVVSPWTGRGKGENVILDHCSILKTVLARFFGSERPFLSDRISASNSFEAFITESAPRLDVPPFQGSLPPLPLDQRKRLSPTTRITTKALSRKEMRAGPVDYHVLTGRWARQLGR